MIKYISIVTLSLFLLLSCDNGSPIFPVEPQIEFIDIQPKEARQYLDSIVITFHFTDGDGNLGDDGSGDNKNNLIIKDNRSHFPDSLTTNYFTLPNLEPDAKNKAIQGKVTIYFPPTIVTPGLTEEETDFTIHIFDRAGNKSNEIVTDRIKIVQ